MRELEAHKDLHLVSAKHSAFALGCRTRALARWDDYRILVSPNRRAHVFCGVSKGGFLSNSTTMPHVCSLLKHRNVPFRPKFHVPARARMESNFSYYGVPVDALSGHAY
jgi:hypothetical protein